MVLNPTAENIRKITKKIIRLCTKAPNKIIKNRKSPQKTHTLKKIQHKLQTNVKILEKTKVKNYKKILKLTALAIHL